MRIQHRRMEDGRWRTGIAALAAFALLLALGGCAGREQNGDHGQDRATIALRTDPATPTSGPVRLLIHLSTPAGMPLVGARVSVVGNMSHAGMQPVSGEAREQGGGDYVVEGFTFTMGGDWLLTIRATLADGTTVQKTIPINGVAGMTIRPALARG